MSKKISTLSPGNIVNIKENGENKQYIFLQYNHYAAGEVVLIRKNVAGFRAFSPSGQSSYNAYEGSDIDSFCNEQHIQCLDPIIRASLVNVGIPTAYGHVGGTWNATVRNLKRKCFLLSCNEVGLSGIVTEGSAFSYFSSNALRMAYAEGNANAVYWWLRSSYPYSNYNSAWSANSAGTLGYNYSYFANYTVRPALALSSDILVSSATDVAGCYNIEGAPAAEEYQKVNGVWKRMC